MSKHETMGHTAGWRLGRGAASIALAAAVLAGGAGPAGAHGGDAAKVHSCIVASSGTPKLIAPDASCDKNDLALDWSAVDTNTTYGAGSGLSLSAGNVFSVTGAPWGGLTGVPAGFADGVDDVGQSVDMKSDEGGATAPKGPNDNDGFVHWNHLEGVPSAILAAQSLSENDGAANEGQDPVSFSKIKDLTTPFGDGRITGAYIANDTITLADIASQAVGSDEIRDGEISARDLAGRYADVDGNPTTLEQQIIGAVTGEKIADGSVESRDLAPGVIDRYTVTKAVDPPSIEPGTRAAVTIPFSQVGSDDLVTLSPPAGLADDLIFAGSDVAPGGGAVTAYLYNASGAAIDDTSQTWTIRGLRTGS
jgi:hypothetical protein